MIYKKKILPLMTVDNPYKHTLQKDIVIGSNINTSPEKHIAFNNALTGLAMYGYSSIFDNPNNPLYDLRNDFDCKLNSVLFSATNASGHSDEGPYVAIKISISESTNTLKDKSFYINNREFKFNIQYENEDFDFLVEQGILDSGTRIDLVFKD